MKSADVSIVLPFRDHEHLVGKSVRSIAEYFKALELSCEIIAVDEDSGDNSQAVLALLRNEIPSLRVVMGRGYAAGSRIAQAPVLVLMQPEAAAQGICGSLAAAMDQVSGGHLDMNLVDEHMLVCLHTVSEELIASTIAPRYSIERKLLHRARSRGLAVQSYGPESGQRGLSGTLGRIWAAVVPRASGLHRAW